MINVMEVWNKGTLVSRTETDDASTEEIAIRNAISQAITDLNTIQSIPLISEDAQIAAIKKNSQLIEAIIKFLDRRFIK